MAKDRKTASSAHVCTAPGLTVTGIPGARTFAVGEVIDPAAVVLIRPGGEALTWRDVLGEHLATHFTVQTSAPALVAPQAPAEDPAAE